MIRENEDTARYILDRRCPSGGFCHYRQEEPNCSDSFFACAALELLEVRFDDLETSRYLLGRQARDGSFPSVYTGWYVVSALRALNLAPSSDPSPWVIDQIRLPSGKKRVMESACLFESLYLVSDLCRRFSLEVPSETVSLVESFVMDHQETGGGFGGSVPNITETFHAVSILRSFGCHVPRDDVISFITACEDLKSGLLPLPGAGQSYLEHVHAGSVLCTLVGYRSPVLDACRSVVYRCRHESGGFTRSVYGGSPSLEHTWHAITTLRHLDYLENGTSSRPIHTRGRPSCW